MAKLVIGAPFSKGLKNDVLPFNIDNSNFPTLINSYYWRGRIKRKRGTSPLGRLQRYFNSAVSSYGSTTSITLNASGAANLLTGFSLETNGNIVPSTVQFTDSTASNTYTDDGAGNLTGTPSGSGTINYATGAINIGAGAGGHTINAVTFQYYPDWPVMGLEDLNLSGNQFITFLSLTLASNQFPGTLAFDTTYSYNILPTSPYTIYDVSFYKNLASGAYTDGTHAYVQKTSWTPTSWNGQNYQQFNTVNYQGALWAANGITVPFEITNIGMQYKAIAAVTIISATEATLTITSHGLAVGDFIYVNEVATTTGINFQTAYISSITDANNVVAVFPYASIASNGTGGIAQYLTNRSDPTKDCLRWYDGDPTNGTYPPTFETGLGWVNFMPPLSESSFPIADLPSGQYYLVGARVIIPFKDRLLFCGPVVQTSSAGSQVYLQDTIIFSQNGTPYYTCSFQGPALSPTSSTSILVPENQSAYPAAFFEDSFGFAGYIQAGYAQPILSASPNEDVLIIGFSSRQARLVYNDVTIFNFYIINSELGTSSTFSTINLDRSVMTIGQQGIIQTSQISSQRVDLDIPDQVFEFNLTNNGLQRITAVRDFINEWIYFTYCDDQVSWKFPNQTLLYNYRDNSWGVFHENYTAYGTFRKATGETWNQLTYLTWEEWSTPWNFGESNLLQPEIIAGNQQGFVVIREQNTTNEAPSIYIQSFAPGATFTTITSPDHCLNNNDYIVIYNCIGTISSEVNGKIFKVSSVSENTFTIPIVTTGAYSGAGTITKMYVPYIQTKQFPLSWDMARKTRVGFQQYLLTKTTNGQVELQIFLSQNPIGPNIYGYNRGPFYPEPNSLNDALVYSDIVYTCPESTNLGLTPANTNLQMPTANNQGQIWHRINTSLIGDTIQLGITLSDVQMLDSTFSSQFEEIELHGIVIDIHPSQLLA